MIAKKDTFINVQLTHKCTHYTHTQTTHIIHLLHSTTQVESSSHNKIPKVSCCHSSSELVIGTYGIISGLLPICTIHQAQPHLPPAQYEDTKTKEGSTRGKPNLQN
jgi:hypothetical protein